MLGTLIGLLIGAGAGGTIGYRIGINKNILSQTQNSGNHSEQKQIGKISEGVGSETTENITKILVQKLTKSKKGVKIPFKVRLEELIVISNRKKQRAGNNSQQLQTDTINITNVNGIDEKRAREIFSEMYAVARRDFT